MSNRISTKDLIQELKRLNKITDGSPTQKEMNEMGQYSVMPYQNRFGSWNESLQEAGISPDRTYATEEELLEEIKRINKTTTGSPTQKEMDENGDYSAETYHRRFGSWNNALEEAELSQNKRQFTKEELLRELHRLDDDLDRPPTQSDMNESEKYYAKYYQDKFGSWNEAKATAGIETTEPGGESQKISDSELNNELNRLDEEVSGPPTKKEMQRLGEYSHQLYRRRFGSWNKALEEAGLDKSRKVEKETLLRELCRLDEELDHPPTQSEVNQYSEFSHKTYANKFGSLNTAKQKAGLETRKPGHAGSGQDHPRWKGGYEPYYGPSWLPQRRKALERDSYECVVCGMSRSEHKEKYESDLEVHHMRPFREFGRERHEEANQLDNLVTLCKPHHRQWEALPVQPQLLD